MPKNVIYDYETLGTDTRNAPILSLAIMNYDPDRFMSETPYTFKELCSRAAEYKFDIMEQVKSFGKVINKETLDWWKKQPKELRDAQLTPTPDDLSITELNACFKNHCHQSDAIFTRGNTFDPMITTFTLADQGLGEPYNWGKVRDTRSFIEGLSYTSGLNNKFIPEGLEDVFVAHDPIHDIAIDVMRMQSIIREVFL
tara:strand:- start:1136 stop:1729 length:594 start_codon:yes stop_codon:yes gene_type:complete